MDHFFHCDLGFSGPTEDVTEAIHYARLSCSEQLRNHVVFISFTDKNLLTFATLKNSIITDCTHSPQQRRTLEQNAYSQGRVATRVRCGGILNDCFIANFLGNVPVKESIFAEVVAKTRWCTFFDSHKSHCVY